MRKKVVLLATILALILTGTGVLAVAEEAVSHAAPPLQRPTPTTKPAATKPSAGEPGKPKTKPTQPAIHPVLAPLTAPILRLPEQGLVYQNPITFQWEWEGALAEGQAYQVSAWHPESDFTVQGPSLTDTSWTTSLPLEKLGEWRWNVSLLQDDSALITSAEGMFLFGSPSPSPSPPPVSPTPSPSPNPTPASPEPTQPISMPRTGLGRAIGLPVGIIGVVLVGVLITVRYLRKRPRKQQH
jgi:hypothetical protein